MDQLQTTHVRIILTISLSFMMLLPGAASASGEPPTALKGSASFSTGHQIYSGSYSVSTKSISVDIDGFNYAGNYASVAEDSAGSATGAAAGKWGRAFLFASSAKTLRCQLDEGFPKVSGTCQDAQGRQFQLRPGVAQQTVAVP